VNVGSGLEDLLLVGVGRTEAWLVRVSVLDGSVLVGASCLGGQIALRWARQGRRAGSTLGALGRLEAGLAGPFVFGAGWCRAVERSGGGGDAGLMGGEAWDVLMVCGCW